MINLRTLATIVTTSMFSVGLIGGCSAHYVKPAQEVQENQESRQIFPNIWTQVDDGIRMIYISTNDVPSEEIIGGAISEFYWKIERQRLSRKKLQARVKKAFEYVGKHRRKDGTLPGIISIPAYDLKYPPVKR